MNKIILKGILGRAPTIWHTQDGRQIATFSLATTIYWKACYDGPDYTLALSREITESSAGKPSEWRTCTDWHRITVFRESTVKWVKETLKKGDIVYVEGRLSYHHWTDKLNLTRLTPHIVVAGSDGKIEYLRSSQSNSQKNEHRSEKGQGSSFTENKHHCSLSEDPSSTPLEPSHNKGETTYENENNPTILPSQTQRNNDEEFKTHA